MNADRRKELARKLEHWYNRSRRRDDPAPLTYYINGVECTREEWAADVDKTAAAIWSQCEPSLELTEQDREWLRKLEVSA